MVIFTKVNGKINLNKAKEKWYIMTIKNTNFMKETGLKIKDKDLEEWNSKMEVSMMVNLKTIK